MKLALFLALALSIVWSTTPRVGIHSHAGPEVHGHIHGHALASGPAHYVAHEPERFGSSLADHVDSFPGIPLDEELPDSGAAVHWHAGILLLGAVLGPVEWSFTVEDATSGGRFPDLRSIAREPGATDTPLRPPRLES